MEKWKKGSGVLLFGTFVMLLTMTMCLFFVQTFYLQQEHLDAQTAADSIADATAVYAAMESSDYDDVVNHARDVQRLVSAQTGVNTSNLTVDQTELEENNKVSVSLGILGKFIKDITLTSGRDANGNSLNLGDYNATARATTEFTRNGASVDYVQWMIDIANDDSIGYSLFRRYMNPDVDCSSFVFYALKNAGYDVGNTPFATGSMDAILTGCGFQCLSYDASILQEGDILWREIGDDKHTEVYIGDGMNVGAHLDYDGVPGDSSGREVSVDQNYGNWLRIYRPQ